MTIPPDPNARPCPAPDSREERGTSDRPSANRTNNTVAQDLPLQFPLPLSTIDSDVTIAGPSPRELIAERIGDCPPGPSDLRDNIVYGVHQAF